MVEAAYRAGARRYYATGFWCAALLRTVILVFGLALAAKPMVVTLPLVSYL